MQTNTLLKSQKNQVYDAIRNMNLDPAAFFWDERFSERSGAMIHCLIHQSTNFYFDFDLAIYSSGMVSYSITFSPGKSVRCEKCHIDSWESVHQKVLWWLSYLKRECEAPDIWETVFSERKIIETATADKSNEPFSDEEKQYIASSLHEVKEFVIANYVKTEQQKRMVERQLEYLVDASKRLGRKDWLLALYSVLISLAIAMGMDTRVIPETLRFAGDVLGKILQKFPMLS